MTGKPYPIVAAHDFARRFSMRAGGLMWLLGAGASAAAGIPTAWDMIWEFKQQLFVSQWQCYRILAQECWPILAHPPSCNLRSARLDRGAFCGLESQSGFVRAAPSGA